jgi:sugar lactone lactonase YvrE
MRLLLSCLTPAATLCGCSVVCLVATTACSAQVKLQLQPGGAATTFAGNGRDGAAASGVATAVALGSPRGITYDSNGNVFVADAKNNVVMKVASDGSLRLVAGNGRQGYAGDGANAIAAEFNGPSAVVIDAAGNLYIADTRNNRVREVTSSGIISTVAGSGSSGNAGDGGPAAVAQLRQPRGLALDASGNLYIADTGNHRVRERRSDGTLVAVAGTGVEGDDGDGRKATAATLQAPTGLAFLADGSLLITDTAARRIRVVSLDGTIRSYMGATVRRPEGAAADADGSVYVADADNQDVVQSSADGASTVAGSGEQGAFVAGSPIASALDSPAAVTIGGNGDLLVSDRRNHQIQRVALPRLTFGSIGVGTTSATQTVTLTNGGAQSLQVLAVALPAGFGPAGTGSTCGATPFALQPGMECVVALDFTPTSQGIQSGIAQVRVSGSAPQSVLLTGTGAVGGALAQSTTVLSVNGSISYAGAPVMVRIVVTGGLAASPAGTVSLYDGTAALSTNALTAGSSQISTSALTLGPHVLHATYNGDAHYASSTSAAVSETVVGAPDFSIATSSASYSGNAGTDVTASLTLTPMNGTLNHTVAFGVTGLPNGATVTFVPAVIMLGGNPVPVTVTLHMPVTLSSAPRSLLQMLAGALFVALAFVRQRRIVPLLALLVFAAVVSGGCGSGFRGGANVGGSSGSGSWSVFRYNAVVTATTTGVLGDILTHSVTVGLVVTQ